jgi:hypothetical protein
LIKNIKNHRKREEKIMENASKALIIAGAILISIVLITLGVVILGQGQDVVNSSNMDATAIQSWNSQFTQYQGTRVTGAQVNALLDSVVSNNNVSNRNGDTNKVIAIKMIAGKNSSNQIAIMNTYARTKTDGTLQSASTSHNQECGTSSITTKAKSGALYEVTFAYNTQGFVSVIGIKDVA